MAVPTKLGMWDGGALEHLASMKTHLAQKQEGEKGALHPWFPWYACYGRQRAHSHQVVHYRGEGEHPAHPGHVPMSRLPQQPHGLQSPKELLPSLPFVLTDGITWIVGRPDCYAYQGVGVCVFQLL
jgi:hypothetical protein